VEIQINVDCDDLDAMVAFYTAALGYEPFGNAGDRYRSIVAPDGHGPKLVFQKVPEPKLAKNRVHLDVHASGGPDTDREVRRERVAAEVTRLGAAGATVFREVDEMGEHWVVMQDPEGNEFCVQ